MVQIQKSEKKTVYRYLLQEGVIVIHKDFTSQPHKGTNVPNIHVRTLLRSLKDRGFVELVFNWQYFYYFINNEGKKFLTEHLGLTEEVVPLTWKKDEKRQYEHLLEDRGRKIRRDREERPQGERRGGRGAPRGDFKGKRDETAKPADKPAEVTA
jgi:small subunit ribosomal protein S10e